MKTKLLFCKIQNLKNGVKLKNIFTVLIIFFMTVSSFGQTIIIEFDCLAGGNSLARIEFQTPDPFEGVYDGTAYFGATSQPGWTLEYISITNRWVVQDPPGGIGNFFITIIPVDSTTLPCSSDAWAIDPEPGGGGTNPCDSVNVITCNPPTPDSDGDGVPDTDDVCEGFDDNLDADADSIPDGCDICPGFDDTADTDGDTIPDGCDNCLTDANADQSDLDGDGTGNVCDDDVDGDGFVNADDCNDNDPSINAAITYYVDSDGDGFGTTPEDICSSTAPTGYASIDGDCDDLEYEVYPGAPEICDGLDNNCDGQIDEGIDGCIDGVIIEYCDDKQKKILICHNGKTKCVSINAMDAHLAHGDYLGTCGGSGREAEVLTEETPTSYDVVSWPNPTNDFFNVKMTTPNTIDKVSLNAFDINGRLIHSTNINGNEDYEFGERLQSGIYFVKISQANTTEVIKVIKR